MSYRIRKRYSYLTGLFALLLSITSGTVFAQSSGASGNVQRVALVIGNSAYQGAPLANPVNDARAMAVRLRSFGFDVMLRENLKAREIGGTYREFRSKIKPGAVALVFYAGHGIQVKGQNYFPAVDSDIASEEDVPLQSLNLGTLLDNMEEARAGVSLVFLDACRDNPFARRFRSASRGLAKVEAASGTLIHYATKPGSVAADGEGKNGTYTEALLAQMSSPLPVELMLKQVTNAVVTKTKGRQEPWVEGSLRGDFYFNFQTVTATQSQTGAAADPSANDRALWEAVRDSKDMNEIRAYLDQFPKGLFAGVANARLKALSAPVAPPVQVASVVPNIAATRPQAAQGALASMTRGTVFRDCADCPEMVVIPAGSFTMGSPQSEASRDNDEGPQHSVRIPRSIAMGKFEVTRGQFARFVQESGYSAGSGCYVWDGKQWNNDASKDWRNTGFAQSDEDPVACVNWNDAKAYVEWLARKSGQRYRLPSEAEWEYGARAGTTTAFSFGDRITPQLANYGTTVSYAGSPVATTPRKTVPVGSYAPNAFGLYDVHGNVFEWTEDCYNANYNGAPSDGAAWTSGDCGRRVLRGGAWFLNPQFLRSALRVNLHPTIRYDHFGFRLARTD